MISSKSHFSYRSKEAGFSVAELITVIFIVTIISGIIIGNQSKYSSAAELKNLAQQLALSIRQAQVFGITVKEASPGVTATFTSYSTGYGVVFRLTSPGSRNNYRFFADLPNPNLPPGDATQTYPPGNGLFNSGTNNINWNCTGTFDINGSGISGYECIPPINIIPANYRIFAICAITQVSPYAESCSDDIGGGVTVDSGIFEVDITYRRPNVEAKIVFNRDDTIAYSSPSTYGVKIVLSNLDGSKRNSVSIYKTGQISVQ